MMVGTIGGAVLLGGVSATSLPTQQASAEVGLPTPGEGALSVGAPLEEDLSEDALSIDIIDWPITYDEERARLTGAFLAYRTGKERTGDHWQDATIIPRVVVLHHTAGPSAESAWNTFSSPRARGRNLKEHQQLNTSTQFVVERDGTIYRLFDETLAGRHVIGLNHVAIGVENVGGIRGYPLTDAQVESNAQLIRYLKESYPTITHVIGHHEYRKMEDHPYFSERDPKFRTVKIDPGEAFMAKVRAAIPDVAVWGASDRHDALAMEDR